MKYRTYSIWDNSKEVFTKADKQWQQYKDRFMEQQPNMSTHKICVLLKVVENYVIWVETEKIQKYKQMVSEPIQNIQYNEYVKRIDNVCKQLNIELKWEEINQKVKDIILHEKNEQLDRL
jgi:hypothetical protein